MYSYRLLIVTVLFYLIQIKSNLVISSILEDDVQYVFKWPGHLFNLEDVIYMSLFSVFTIIYYKFFFKIKDMKQNIDMLDITTNNLEKYKCAIPVDLPDDEAANLAAVNYLFRVYNLILNKIILKFKENKIFEQNQIVTSSLFDPIYNRKFCSYRVIYDFHFLD